MPSHLDQSYIAQQKTVLLEKRARLEEDLAELVKNDPYLQPGRELGNAEETDEAILEDRAKEEMDIKTASIEKMLEQVNKALARIDSGEYGICEVTGEEIDRARLEAYPEATTTLEAEQDAQA